MAVWLSLAIVTNIQGRVHGDQVSGVLLDSAGAARPTVQLLFVDVESRRPVQVSTNLLGQFEVDLAPGLYEVFEKSGGGEILLAQLEVADGGLDGLQLQPAVDGPQKEEALRTIGEFEIGWGRADTIEDQSLTDVINPFPARRQRRLYGSVYEFHRNDNLDARNFFDPVGERLPEYKRNQFGATAGYTLTDRIRLLGSYEGLRIVQGSTALSHIPTPAMKRGDFSELGRELIDPLSGLPFPDNRIPEDRISPVASQLLSVVPDPNRPDPDRNYVNNDPVVRNRNHFNVRADYELAPRSSLVAEYYYTGGDRADVKALPAFNSFETERHQDAAVAYNQPLTERLLMYARIGFIRNRVFSLSDNANRSGLLDSLGIKGLQIDDPTEEGFPQINLTGYADLGDRGSPRTLIRNRINFDSSVTYVLQNHTLRAGYGFNTRQLNNHRSDGVLRGEFGFSGDFTGDAFADFLLGYPKSASRGTGLTRVDLRHYRWDAFFSDQWRVSPRLMLNFGLSYRLVLPFRSIDERISGFYPLLFEPPRTGEIVVRGTPSEARHGLEDLPEGSLVYPDRDDWAPSFGFAFNPLGSNRLVLRGSYGIWYDSPGEWLFVDTLTRNYPIYFIENVNSVPSAPEIQFHEPFGAAAEPELTIRGIEPRLENPMVHNWRLAVQNEISRNWSLEASYQGQRGFHLTRRLPANVPLPGEGTLQNRRPNPDFGRFSIVSGSGRSWRETLELRAERRLVDGISFRSGFRWNRIMDDIPDGDPQNPRYLDAEKATVRWTAKRRLFLNYIVDLPFHSISALAGGSDWVRWMFDGWRLSGITEIEDGRPFSVIVPGDPNNDGVYSDRPDRIADGNLAPDARSVDRWFDTLAFVAPDQYSFGNAGRNILMGPAHQAWDVSVIKRTRFSDGNTLELRVELFNAFNHVNFDRPNTEYGTTSFGKIFGADRAREIEVALKYTF